MPICSYLVIPERGAEESLVGRIEALPGCDVTRAENDEVLLLVTDTPDPESDRKLRDSLEALEGIYALVLTFGEIDPDTGQADPVAESHRAEGRGAEGRGKGRRKLPVVDPGGLRPAPGPVTPAPSSSEPSPGSDHR